MREFISELIRDKKKKATSFFCIISLSFFSLFSPHALAKDKCAPSTQNLMGKVQELKKSSLALNLSPEEGKEFFKLVPEERFLRLLLSFAKKELVTKEELEFMQANYFQMAKDLGLELKEDEFRENFKKQLEEALAPASDQAKSASVSSPSLPGPSSSSPHSSPSPLKAQKELIGKIEFLKNEFEKLPGSLKEYLYFQGPRTLILCSLLSLALTGIFGMGAYSILEIPRSKGMLSNPSVRIVIFSFLTIMGLTSLTSFALCTGVNLTKMR